VSNGATVADLDSPTSAGARPWWVRLHAALMPDYNRRAAAYWWTMSVLGLSLLAGSMAILALQPLGVVAQVTVMVVITMLAGLFPVRIPHSTNSFAAGEVFIFLLLLTHGPLAALVAAGCEGAVGALRTSKRWTSRIFTPAVAAISMGLAGGLFNLASDTLAAAGMLSDGLLIGMTMAFGVGYFLLNSTLVSTVPRLKRGEPFRTRDLIGVFGWVGIANAISAAVASLLYVVLKLSGMGVLAALIPGMVLLLVTLHYFFRQQESAEAARRSIAEAQQRESELAARHVQELEASERRFHSAFTHASIGMTLLSFDGRILQANESLRTLLDLGNEPVEALRIDEFVSGEDEELLLRHLGLVDAQDFEAFALELRLQTRRGRAVWVAAHCSFFSEPGSSAPCLILQVHDITARRNAEDDLHHFAFHDSLTGLPNRRRFHDLLSQAIDAARGNAGPGFAVMFLDFDRFKLINDSLGHKAGDDFLVQVSRRIQEHLRPGDVVARLGGDEFAVLVRPLLLEREAIALAERLMEALARPFSVAGTEISTSASIGITFSAFGYAGSDEMLRDADTAMYKAKAAGKARYALFDASLHTEVAARLKLEGDLRRAFDDGQVRVVYQPIFDLDGGALRGFEALARWQHPTDGEITPDAFIPVAEETGLIVRLSDVVLQSACRQLRDWQRLHPALADLQMSVNISANDIAHPSFVPRVTRAIVESGLQARHLTLELTENIITSRVESALPLLAELRELGVGLAIDDFGTGYSSLSHLSSLPIDTLKIDRSFVRKLKSGSNEAAVVQAVVLLGSSLGKAVVAEGIETPTQLDQLQALGCDFGQGYHMSRPLEAHAARQLIDHMLEGALRTKLRVATQPEMLLH
jgi:diguanylate cyclase (GGDEF)-like protein/PAS domain S-box-containing protein